MIRKWANIIIVLNNNEKCEKNKCDMYSEYIRYDMIKINTFI